MTYSIGNLMRFYGNANGSTGGDSTALIRQRADRINFTAKPVQAERVNACTSRRMHVYRPRVTHCEKHGLLTSTLNGHFVTTVNAVGGRLKVVCEVREGHYHRQSNDDIDFILVRWHWLPHDSGV